MKLVSSISVDEGTMRRLHVTVFLALVTQSHTIELVARNTSDAHMSMEKLVDKLANTLVDKASQAWPRQHADLDQTLLAKTRPDISPGTVHTKPLFSAPRSHFLAPHSPAHVAHAPFPAFVTHSLPTAHEHGERQWWRDNSQKLYINSATKGVRPVSSGRCLSDALPPGREVKDLFAVERPVEFVERRRDDGRWDVILSAVDEKKQESGNDVVLLGQAADLPQRASKAFSAWKACSKAFSGIRWNKNRYDHIRLGVVVMLEDKKGRILLTRRHKRMRTFPRAWVGPGGSVDPGETLREGGAREVLEETGLRVDPAALELIGLWESVFPRSKKDCSTRRGMQPGHYLIVYYRAKLDPKVNAEDLKLSAEEVDAAVWVDYRNLQKAISFATPAGTMQAVPDEVSFSQLSGTYPNSEGEGIALGHKFILQKLLQQHSVEKINESAAQRAFQWNTIVGLRRHMHRALRWRTIVKAIRRRQRNAVSAKLESIPTALVSQAS